MLGFDLFWGLILSVLFIFKHRLLFTYYLNIDTDCKIKKTFGHVKDILGGKQRMRISHNISKLQTRLKYLYFLQSFLFHHVANPPEEIGGIDNAKYCFICLPYVKEIYLNSRNIGKWVSIF